MEKRSKEGQTGKEGDGPSQGEKERREQGWAESSRLTLSEFQGLGWKAAGAARGPEN